VIQRWVREFESHRFRQFKEQAMSHEEDKFRNSRRRFNDETKIQRQVGIAKSYAMHQGTKWKYIEQPHRNHKTAILNCGDPRCYMCMNPRRALGQETMQERKHKQQKYYKDSNEKSG
jgi:hypothetical protein